MRRVLVGIVVSAIGLVACGDGGESLAAVDDAVVTDSAVDSDAGDSESEDAEASDADASDPDAGESEGGDVQDVLDDLDFGDGLARVTIGDTSYEFTLGGNEAADGTTYMGVCQEFFGLINGGGFVSGDPEIGIEFTIPPPDWESFDDGRFDDSQPRIEVELGDSGGWAADMTLAENFPAAAGESQVDEWTLEGSVATGRATFIEMEPFSAPVEGSTGVEGSFEIGCEGS